MRRTSLAMQPYSVDGRPDYEALTAHAEQQDEQAETLHLAALWRELATTYRELGQYHRRPHASVVSGSGGNPG